MAQDGRGVVVRTRGERVRCDFCVVAVPLPALRRIAFRPGLPTPLARAADEAQYGAVVKTLIQYRRRFWRERGYSGDVLSDLPLASTWDATDRQRGRRGVLISYASAGAADQVGELPKRERVLAAAADLEAIFPGSRALVARGHSVAWATERYSGGSWVAFAPGQMTAFWHALRRRHGRVYFAGEHTDAYAGYMEGAVRRSVPRSLPAASPRPGTWFPLWRTGVLGGVVCYQAFRPETMPMRQILGANPAMRRAWLAHNTGHTLDAVAEMAFAPEETRGRIENLVGATHMPLGIAGPIRVNGQHADGQFFVPFATTEGTLVTTYQYGMRAITEAGGANAYVVADALDITPCFVLATTRDALALASWLDDHLPELQALAAESTAHGRLVEIRPHLFGRRIFAQFVFSTGDAMGLNMVNLAVDRICRHVAETVPCERWYLRCNYSSDKKPAAINLFRPYGKEVAIDLTLPANVVEAHLGVSPGDLVEFAASGRLGIMQAGALGANAHFANGLAAIYVACGQDVAQIVNASIGFLDVELVGDDLYVAARLPNLVVGTVGGGTSLPTQRECLALLGCDGDGTARKFAEIVGATLVAGDLAICAALANDRFIEAHRRSRLMAAGDE